MKENTVGPFSRENASKCLTMLLKEAGVYNEEYFPFVGTLEASYGYDKIIGYQTRDNAIRYRIDYDKTDGVHFNYEDYSDKKKPFKLKILTTMTLEEYKDYVDGLNKGRFTEASEGTKQMYKDLIVRDRLDVSKLDRTIPWAQTYRSTRQPTYYGKTMESIEEIKKR